MFWRKRKQSDFMAEIEAHLELEMQQLKEQGLGEEEARLAARRAFGNVTRAEERFYEAGRWMWWDHLIQDLRFGLRTLRKNPVAAPRLCADHSGSTPDSGPQHRSAFQSFASRIAPSRV